jgi:tRNA A37 methylthiotransferase MiaB
VLVCEKHPKKAGEMIGRSESYRVVNFASPTPSGRFTRVKITGASPHSLRGEECRD